MDSKLRDARNDTEEVPESRAFNASSMFEVSVIDNMASFLEAHAGSNIDPKVLRNMAEALSKKLNDTSPGNLQDVTMENSYGVGYRSPCPPYTQCQSPNSPTNGHGRSVRDFEEQMTSLRKENFNLKLRLYFIEENIPGYKGTNPHDGQETMMKQLIDSKVEMEILRKDLQEKQNILKDAAAAMNQMEQFQKENDAKNLAVIEELNQKVQFLEMERELNKSKESNDIMEKLLADSEHDENVDAKKKIRELEDLLSEYESKVTNLQGQINKLDEILVIRDETITECETRIKGLIFKNDELADQLQAATEECNSAKIKQLRDELQELKAELADKACMLLEAEEKLKSREQIHEQACRTIKKLMLTISNQQTQIKSLQRGRDAAAASGSEHASSAGELNCTGVCELTADTEAFNELWLAEKQRLEKTIAEQEVAIQGLKSEVKKKTANLQNLVNKELWEKNREIERLTKLVNHTGSSPVSGKMHKGDELQRSFSDAEYQKALERNKLLQKKVDILIQRLGVEGSNEVALNKLRCELREARDAADEAEKWRRECADVCTVLTNRLEELAGFLNSLLKHKDVLGVLAADRRRAIRKAVDRSLDLSKSLNMTLSFSGVSFADQSLAQLSNLSEILGDVEGHENKTFNSHEELHARQSIENLKAENTALKKELDKRRSTDTKKDRRSLPLTMAADQNQSESEAWSEPDRKVSLARIGLEDHSASLSKETAPQHMETDSESDALNQSRTSKARHQERILQLEQLVAQRDDRILEIQCQLVEADNRLKKENLRVMDMTQELEQLRKRNEELHSDLVAIGSQPVEPEDASADLTLLMQQIEEKSQAMEKLEEECERLGVEVHFANIQIQSLRDEKEDERRKYKQALANAAAEETAKLDALRGEMVAAVDQALQEQSRDYEQKLERECVARSDYEAVRSQLVALQQQYVAAQESIDSLSETEQKLRQDYSEVELESRSLRKQLDESTLQASRALVERTKALNEKMQLEKHVAKLEAELETFAAERKRLEDNVRELQEQQVALKMAAKLNGSDVSHSGYTSEDVPQMQAKGPLTNSNAANVQRLNNSSPDLGIESDAGRVSSVELASAQRAQLRTVEVCNKHLVADIKEEIKNEENSNPAEPTAAATTTKVPIHDCAQVEQENLELRRKLNRTKRAFEDTYEKLRISNQKKAQIEKDIKNQILKTHNVLKNVRANMENEI